MTTAYDVVVVGAGLAGCTAARLYGERGLRVALLDQRTRMDDYKRTCTHFIQPAGVPVIERVGLAPLIEEAGGLRNRLDTWTRWGWIRVPEPEDGSPRPYGYSIRRQTLDPMIRRLAAATPGVDLMLGTTARRLLPSKGCLGGIVARRRDGSEEELAAPLVVAADGRGSSIGQMSGVRARVRPNNRFAYFAYYRGLELRTDATAQMWVLEPDMVIAQRNEDGVALVCCFVERSRLPEFKRDPERQLTRLVASLPQGPDIRSAERISPVLGKLEMPNSSRRAAVPGLAFVGDAAMTGDPFWAIGCGWAFQSAGWLVDCTAHALAGGGDLDRALRRYRRRHRSRLGGFYLQSTSYSTARPLLPHERLLLASAARDREMARVFTGFGEGLVGLRTLVGPRSLGRAARVVLAHRVRGSARREGVAATPGA